MEIAYPNIAERLFGRPHAIEPGALRAIMDGPLARRVLNGEKLEKKRGKRAGGRDIRKDRLAAIADAEPVRTDDGIVDYAITPDGVAILSINGVLSRRFDWLAATCGWTTYEGLDATLAKAMADSRTKAVLFDVDSPGGEADGMLDIADKILSARGQGKPIWAVANTLAASAAYAIAGSADKLYLPRLAVVGSIGCVTVHVDQSKADESEGLSYTAVYSGARKIDGWAHAPLSEEALSATQASVDYVRDQFAELVARQGRLDVAAALATEAAVYTDQQAVEAGLANGVMTFTEALAELTSRVSRKTGAFTMSKTAQAAVEAPEVQAVVEEQAVQAVAETVAQAEVAQPEVEATLEAKSAADVAPDMQPPSPGENCKLCGQKFEPEDDDDDDGDEEDENKNDRNAIAAVYGTAEMDETLSLCSIAGVGLEKARAFISAKTPIDKVRSALLDARAAAADSREIVRADLSSTDETSSQIIQRKHAINERLRREDSWR